MEIGLTLNPRGPNPILFTQASREREEWLPRVLPIYGVSQNYRVIQGYYIGVI